MRDFCVRLLHPCVPCEVPCGRSQPQHCLDQRCWPTPCACAAWLLVTRVCACVGMRDGAPGEIPINQQTPPGTAYSSYKRQCTIKPIRLHHQANQTDLNAAVHGILAKFRRGRLQTKTHEPERKGHLIKQQEALALGFTKYSPVLQKMNQKSFGRGQPKTTTFFKTKRWRTYIGAAFGGSRVWARVRVGFIRAPIRNKFLERVL